MKLLLIALLTTLGLAKSNVTYLHGKCISDTFYLPCRVYSDDRIYINGKMYRKYVVIGVAIIDIEHRFMIKEKK
jgi:hypothetical protein